MTNFNLFALTNDPANRCLRFSLSKDVQHDLTSLIKNQEANFNKNAVDEVPFDGKYKPEHDEVLVINDYDDIDNLGYAINSPLSIQEITPDPSVFLTIKALFTGYVDSMGVPVILVQNFDKKKNYI